MNINQQTKNPRQKQCSPPSIKETHMNNEIPSTNLKFNEGKINIHFTSSFKYLGSYTTTDFSNETETNADQESNSPNIGNTQRFLCLQRCWQESQITDFYAGGPLNTLLWGEESWSITDKILRKLQAFHHTSIKRVLGIRMDEVQSCHVMNE